MLRYPRCGIFGKNTIFFVIGVIRDKKKTRLILELLYINVSTRDFFCHELCFSISAFLLQVVFFWSQHRVFIFASVRNDPITQVRRTERTPRSRASAIPKGG